MSIRHINNSTKTYQQSYVELAKIRPVKAYRLLTELLHNVATISGYTDSQILLLSVELYQVAYKQFASLFFYHGLLYRNIYAFQGYFYLYSRPFVHQTLKTRASELIQKIQWRYELDTEDLAIDLLLLNVVRNRLVNVPYVDPEPVLKYVLDSKRDKELKQRERYIQLWNKYQEHIVGLYKKTNPFMTEQDIWFCFVQVPIDVWQNMLQDKLNQRTRKRGKRGRKPKRKQKKQEVHQINIEEVTYVDVPYTPDHIAKHITPLLL